MDISQARITCSEAKGGHLPAPKDLHRTSPGLAGPRDVVNDLDEWPNTEVETTWVPGAGIWLRTEALGTRLPSVPLVDPSELDPEVCARLETPAEGSDAVQRIIAGRLSDLLATPPPES